MRYAIALSLCLLACTAESPYSAQPDAGMEEPPETDAGPTEAPICQVTEMETDGVITLVGSRCPGYVDGPRETVRFNNPVNVLYHDETLYVADRDNDAIRTVALDGSTSTLYRWNAFIRPFGLAMGSTGKLLVLTDKGGLDPMQGALWELDISTGDITLLDNDIGTPRGLLYFTEGSVLLSDRVNNTLTWRRPDGSKELLAGTPGVAGYQDGEEALFDGAYDMVRFNGDIIVADRNNNALRRVDPVTGYTSTVGRLPKPQALAEKDGAIYVTSTETFTVHLWKDGELTQVAGNGTLGVDDADDPMQASFSALEGMDFGPDYDLLVADGNRGDDGELNHMIRWIRLN